jgi:hypothetical protein
MTLNELITLLDEAVTNMEELNHNRGDFDLLGQQISQVNRCLEDGTYPKDAVGFQTAVFIVSAAINNYHIAW